MQTSLASIGGLLFLAMAAPADAGEPLWMEIAQLYGSDIDAGDLFGGSVSVDGSTLVVGAYGKYPGAVYVFERLPDAPTRWQQVAKLTPTFPGDTNFGLWVKHSGDTITVGSSAEGKRSATHLYQRGTSHEWGFIARFVVDAGVVALEGDTLAASNGADVKGEIGAGAVYMFERGPDGPADWRYVTTLTASDANAQDHFGQRGALSGDRMLIAAPGVRDLGFDAGAAYIFERAETGAWTEVVKLFGSDVDTDDQFGYAVGLDAETAIVGTNADGDDHAAYVFQRDPAGSWLEIKKLIASDPDRTSAFAETVAISGDVAVAGAWNYDLGDLDGAGAAYVFERHVGGTDTWGEVAKLVASDPRRLDQFGKTLAFDRNTLVVGVDGDDDRGLNAGAVYLFSRTAPLLSVTGSCPGDLRVMLIGTTPAGRVVLLGAESEGITPIPAGPCVGTEVGLDRPRLLVSGTAMSGGDWTLTRGVGPGTCGRYLQALDLDTCATSNAARVP